MRNILKFGAVVALAAPAVAFAQEDATGFYGALSIGGASVGNIRATEFAPAGDIFVSEVSEESVQAQSVPAGSDTLTGKFKLKSAVSFGATLGYDFGMIRTDVEVSYARNKFKSFTLTGGSAGGTAVTQADALDAFCAYEEVDCPASGSTVGLSGSKLRQLNAIGNVWVDIPTGTQFEPYVGGGLGIAGFELNGDGKARFAWQLGGGVAYKIAPKIAITGDVRYRQASGLTLNDEGFGIEIGKIKTWNYGLGLRFTF